MVPKSLSLCLNLGLLALSAAATQPGPDYSGKCSSSSCHGPLKKHAVVHPPVSEDACDACHEPVEEETHSFTFTEEGVDLCLECHDEHEGETVHHPVANDPCTTCHNPHASDGPKLLIAPTIGELCEECHDDVTEDLDFLHGPVATGACTACHDPHASDLPKLLSAEDGELCVKCHKSFDVKNAAKAYVHEPVKQGCMACHNPHGGDNRMNLSDMPPGLCLDCHDELAELIEDAPVDHEAVEIDRSCLNCHTPHMSEHEYMLLKTTMPLCLSCHDKPIKSGDRTVINIAQRLKDGNPHGPIRDQDCAACHKPHGGEYAHLLAEAFPAGFYTPFSEESYALCFECHDVEAFEDEETDSLTNFRNGERNLHYLHVNREVKGRTCLACHDPHAGNDAPHITDSVPFGEWRIPISFEKTETGGSCQPGCHRPYGYDREEAVVNIAEPAPAPDSEN